MKISQSWLILSRKQTMTIKMLIVLFPVPCGFSIILPICWAPEGILTGLAISGSKSLIFEKLHSSSGPNLINSIDIIDDYILPMTIPMVGDRL